MKKWLFKLWTKYVDKNWEIDGWSRRDSRRFTKDRKQKVNKSK
jgi:hypothetical protein